MNHSKFAVSSFENRNGVTSWRVDGRLHGVRIRKNFKTREEAAAEKAVLKALQRARGCARSRPPYHSSALPQQAGRASVFQRSGGGGSNHGGSGAEGRNGQSQCEQV